MTSIFELLGSVVTPPTPVPESGITSLLLGGAVIAIAAVAGYLKKRR